MIRNPFQDDADAECDFMFLCPRAPDLFARFEARFGLSANQTEHEIYDAERDMVLFEAASLAELFGWLAEHPDFPYSLYLSDPEGRPFMFAQLPGHHICTIPYTLLANADLLSLLQEFNAICGWGSVNIPPPDTMADVTAEMANPSYFKRYKDGKLIPPDAT